MPFSALGLRPEIIKAIDDLGYREPTPIQNRAVPIAMKGRDIVGIAQTGTGKTAAFVWPMLEKIMADRPGAPPAVPVPRGLVLVPTRELAVQVLENVVAYAKYLPIRALPIYGGVSEQPQLLQLKKGADILVATPGRLLDFMSTLSVPTRDIDFLVLDEADRMLDMGFIPDVRRIVRAVPSARQTLFFSATFPAAVEKIAREFLTNPQVVEIGRRATPTETVAQYVFEVPRRLKTALLAHILTQYNLDCVLVFVRTKIMADRLSRDLAARGVLVAALHSNRTQVQRMAALKGFKSGQFPVLVATDIAARGIDVDGISHVINYDFPNHPEDYVHRIGRTGRALAIGDALSLVGPEEMPALAALERFIGRGIPRRVVAGFDERARGEDFGPRGGEAGRGPRGDRRRSGERGPRSDGGRPGRESGGGRSEGERGPRESGAGRRARSGGGRRERSGAPHEQTAAGLEDREVSDTTRAAQGQPAPESAAPAIPAPSTPVIPGESAPPGGGWGRTPKPGRRRR